MRMPRLYASQLYTHCLAVEEREVWRGQRGEVVAGLEIPHLLLDKSLHLLCDLHGAQLRVDVGQRVHERVMLVLHEEQCAICHAAPTPLRCGSCSDGGKWQELLAEGLGLEPK